MLYRTTPVSVAKRKTTPTPINIFHLRSNPWIALDALGFRQKNIK